MARLLQTIKERKEDRISQALTMLSLCEAQDLTEEDKRHFLSIGARDLDDPQVAKKWLELLKIEKNTETKDIFIVYLSSINLRTVESVADFAETVLLAFEAATETRTKISLIEILSQLIKLDPTISENIIASLKTEQHTIVKKKLAEALIYLSTIPTELVGIYESILMHLKEEEQFAVLLKLVRTNNLKTETALNYLQPTTPFNIKVVALCYFADREIMPTKELQALLIHEGDERIREKILSLFVRDTKNIEQHCTFLKEYLTHEQDENTRNVILDFLYRNISMTSEMTSFYLDLLKTEKEVINSLKIAKFLAPFASHEPLATSKIKQAFLEFLETTENAHRIEFIEFICKELSRHIIVDQPLFERLLAIYHVNNDPTIKQSLLYAFCDSLKPDERLLPIYIDAIESPAPIIREYACFGLLPLPLIPKNIPHFLALMPLLLDNDIREIVRKMVALKIVAIPDKSPELIDKLKHIAQNGLGDIKAICETGYEKSLQAQSRSDQTSQVNWSLWENRIKVEKRVDHIFPDILIHYNDNPAMAGELLKTILIDSNCSESLYHATYINKRDIIQFLIAKNNIDQEIALFCLDYLVQPALLKEDNVFLIALNNYPDISLFKEKFWIFFELGLVHRLSFLNILLLRKVMEKAYGSNEFAEEFSKRLFLSTNEKAVTPFLNFLLMSLDWEPTEKMIDKLLTRPELIDKQIKGDFDNCLSNLNKEIPLDFDSTPGFAD